MIDGDNSNSAIEVAFGAYERSVLRGYVLNSLHGRSASNALRLFDELADWLEENLPKLDLIIPTLAISITELRQGKASGDRRVTLSRTEIERNRRKLPRPSAFQTRLDWVTKTLRLTAHEAYCLGCLCRSTQLAKFRGFANVFRDFCGDQDDLSSDLLCKLTALGTSTIRRMLSRRGQLRQLGLIEMSGEDVAPSEMLLTLLRNNTSNPRALETALLGPRPINKLALADFAHLREQADDVVQILRGALDARAPGVGILLHGLPGTGKTEFAKLLGDLCQARIVFVGELNKDDCEPTRADRLAHLSLLSAIAEKAGRLILVVDEADDIIAGVDDDDRLRRTGSKVFVNRLVENSPAPTIWISNRHQSFGPAILRRMLRAIEFRMPAVDVRQRVVTRQAEESKVLITSSDAEALAGLAVSPAVSASSLRAAKLGGGAGAMAIAAARSIKVALGENPRALPKRELVAFDPSLSSSDIDLVEFERRVERSSTKELSFLMTGAPGTGKSAFAHHLASRMGMEVLQKRGSDLKSKYVGETEARIAQAFREAEEDNKFLVFDEADSLLLDRRDAARSWEVSQVNEMLTWMERHPLPFAATSNLLDRLDPATSRRFLFKISFLPMNPDQIGIAFQRFFGVEAPRSALKLEGLTPADFGVAARKASVLGLDDKESLEQLLVFELSQKSCKHRRIGF